MKFLFIIFFCLSFLFGCGGQEFIEYKPTVSITVREIRWQEHSEKAFVLAAAKDKLVLLYFLAKDNPGCKLMDKETFGDPEVAYLMNEKFIPISIDGVMDKYKITKIPTILILSPDGKEITRLERAVGSEGLINYLKLSIHVGLLLKKMDVMDLLNFGDLGLSQH